MSNKINGREIVAIDCEMVGGPYGSRDMLAKIAIVNYNGQVIYDEYVAPTGTVTDYRTSVSGITREKLQNASSFQSVRQTVATFLQDKIIVGHSLQSDLDALQITHNEQNRRDLAKSTFLINNFGKYGQTASLKHLAERILPRRIQMGPHEPAEDAKAAMDIFKTYQSTW